jgi:hypothetical protein
MGKLILNFSIQGFYTLSGFPFYQLIIYERNEWKQLWISIPTVQLAPRRAIVFTRILLYASCGARR